jgi:hypothetical protein
MNLHEAISKQARQREEDAELKRRAATMIAELMMAHFAGPFDDSAFYDEHEDQEMVEYFDNARREDNLYEDMEFRKMIVQMVAKELGVH